MSKPALPMIVSMLFFLGGMFIAFQISDSAWPQDATPTVAATPTNTIPLPPTLSGVVTDANGPVAGATVQIQGKPTKLQTAKDGTFTVTGISGTTPVVLTAWSAGHYVGWTTANPSAPDWKGGTDITITLKPLSQRDNNNYDWYSFDGVKGSASCGLCHREYKEWQVDAHSHSATNPHFIDMYTGTDVQGNVGEGTRLGSDGLPLAPDLSQPYYGPGFQL